MALRADFLYSVFLLHSMLAQASAVALPLLQDEDTSLLETRKSSKKNGNKSSKAGKAGKAGKAAGKVLSKGAKIGIGVGVAILVIIIILIIIFVVYPKIKKRRAAKKEEAQGLHANMHE